MKNSLGENAILIANDILELQGRLRYLKDWEAEITVEIKARGLDDALPIEVSRLDAIGVAVPHRLALVDIPAAMTRRFDYARLRREQPILWHRAVTLTEPASPLTLTFAKSPVWDTIKSTGWNYQHERYDARRYPSRPFGLKARANHLSDIRSAKNALTKKETARRHELAALIAANYPTDQTFVLGGAAKMRTKVNQMRESIDLDVAQATPQLAEYITVTERAAYQRVEFIKIRPEE